MLRRCGLAGGRDLRADSYLQTHTCRLKCQLEGRRLRYAPWGGRKACVRTKKPVCLCANGLARSCAYSTWLSKPRNIRPRARDMYARGQRVVVKVRSQPIPAPKEHNMARRPRLGSSHGSIPPSYSWSKSQSLTPLPANDEVLDRRPPPPACSFRLVEDEALDEGPSICKSTVEVGTLRSWSPKRESIAPARADMATAAAAALSAEISRKRPLISILRLSFARPLVSKGPLMRLSNSSSMTG